MFLVPIDTDAPIYHRPVGTVALIVLNVLVYLVMRSGLLGDYDAALATAALSHGDGLHPLEWLTSNYVHHGLTHLAGNMFFLWGLGLIVEGKVGWRKFLLAYHAIAITECLLEQVCLLRAEPSFSFGSSSAIFGLLVMALVWAPLNELTVFYVVIVRGGLWDCSIRLFAMMQLVMELVMAWMLNFSMSSEILHLAGGAIGGGIAVLFLKRGWVDCENWDLFSVLKGKHLASTLPELARSTVAPDAKSLALKQPGKQLSPIEVKVRHLRKLRKLLASGKPTAALAEFRLARRMHVEFQPLVCDLSTLAGLLHDNGYHREALEIYDEWIARFPEDADVGRLQAAELMVTRQQRPAAAHKLLDPLQEARLTGPLLVQFQRITSRVQELLDSGTIELEGHAWDSE